MDATFGIVVSAHQLTEILSQLPTRTIEWGGQTYPLDEPRFCFVDFPELKASVHNLSVGMCTLLPERFQNGEWKLVSIGDRVLDTYLYELGTYFALIPARKYEFQDGTFSLETTLATLLCRLTDWAVVFIWQDEYIDETVVLGIPQVAIHLRQNLLRLLQSSGEHSGFIAVSVEPTGTDVII